MNLIGPDINRKSGLEHSCVVHHDACIMKSQNKSNFVTKFCVRYCFAVYVYIYVMDDIPRLDVMVCLFLTDENLYTSKQSYKVSQPRQAFSVFCSLLSCF